MRKKLPSILDEKFHKKIESVECFVNTNVLRLHRLPVVDAQIGDILYLYK